MTPRWEKQKERFLFVGYLCQQWIANCKGQKNKKDSGLLQHPNRTSALTYWERSDSKNPERSDSNMGKSDSIA